MKPQPAHIEFDPLGLFGGGQSGKNLIKHRLLWKAICKLEYDQWYSPAAIARVCASIDTRISLNTQQVRWFCSKFATEGAIEQDYNFTRIRPNGSIYNEGYLFRRLRDL